MLELTVSVEVAVPPGLRLALTGPRAAERSAGVTDVERLTVPVSPARLVRVMIDVPEFPA